MFIVSLVSYICSSCNCKSILKKIFGLFNGSGVLSCQRYMNLNASFRRILGLYFLTEISIFYFKFILLVVNFVYHEVNSFYLIIMFFFEVLGIGMTIETKTIGGKTVAEAETGLIMKGTEEGNGIVTKAGVVAEVPIIAKNVEEGDTTMIRVKVGLFTGAHTHTPL